MWFSHRNVTAHWHYDQSHNLFIQMYGRKRVLLIPPSSGPDMHLFPSIHPSYHQSQHSPSVMAEAMRGLASGPGACVTQTPRGGGVVVWHALGA